MNGMPQQTLSTPLVATQYKVRISPIATLVRQTQTYRNSGEVPMEAIYTFEVPLTAVLLEAKVRIDERELALQVAAAAQAEQDYEDALYRGKSAYRIEQPRPGLFTLSLGNLDVGQEVVLTLEWGQLNRWHQNRLAFRLPTTLVPRYGDIEQADMDLPALPVHSILSRHHCDVSFLFDESLALESWACESHSLQVEQEGEHIHAYAKQLSMSRDISLVMHRKQDMEPAAWVLPDTFADGYLTITQLIGKSRADTLKDHNLILVIDCSGSMMGESIRQARAGAMALLDWLTHEQQINIVLFGSGCGTLLEKPQPATPDLRDELAQKIYTIDADMGGTEMAGALKLAAQQAALCQGKTDILLLTDGAIWDTKGCLKSIQSKLRLFTIGVGVAANDEAIEHLAQSTHGFCEIVSGNTSLIDTVRRQYQRMMSGSPEKFGFASPADITAWPVSCDVFAGDVGFLFAAGLSEKTSANLKVVASEGKTCLPRRALDTQEESALWVRLAANERLPFLADDEALAWAQRYQLICRYTNLIVVDEASQVQAGQTQTVQVAHNLPDSFAKAKTNDMAYFMRASVVDDAFVNDASFVTCDARVDKFGIAHAKRAKQSVTSDEMRKYRVQPPPAVVADKLEPRPARPLWGISDMTLAWLATSGLPDAAQQQLRALLATHEAVAVLGGLLQLLAGLVPNFPISHELETLHVAPALKASLQKIIRQHRLSEWAKRQG